MKSRKINLDKFAGSRVAKRSYINRFCTVEQHLFKHRYLSFENQQKALN